METKTEFSELAQMIGERIDAWDWYCCNSLSSEKASYFEDWFKPTEDEMKRYNHIPNVWMEEEYSPKIVDNNLRILALLFAEQIYLDKSQPRNPNI